MTVAVKHVRLRGGSITVGLHLYRIDDEGFLDPQPDAATVAKLAGHPNYRLVELEPSVPEHDAASVAPAATSPAVHGAALPSPMPATKHGRGKRH